MCTGFPGGSVVKNLSANAGDTEDAAGSGRSPGGGNGNPLQYSARKITWTEDPGSYSPGSHKESDTTEHTCACVYMRDGLEILVAS